MPAEMTAQPWPPNYGGRPQHHLDTPLSITCRRIGPRDGSGGGHHDLHNNNDVPEAKPCTTTRSNSSRPPAAAATTKPRHRAKPPSRWCRLGGLHVPRQCWWALVLVTLLCLKLGLCAGFAARESVPFPAARESRPSPASFLSKQEEKEKEDEDEDERDPLARLSKVFGIKRIPGKVFHRTPPQYMTELYREVADTGGLTRAAGPYNANTIRSFPDRDTVHQQHYFYNVSRLEPQESSGEDEHMLEAEFHVFKMKPRPKRSAEAPPPHHLLLKVYQVLDKDKMDRPEGRRLLDAQRVSTHKHGWLTFKVAKAVDSWRVRPQDNQGLLVVAQAPKGQSYGGSYLRFAQRNQHHDSKQPILVVFSDDASSSRKPTLVSPEDQDYKQILEDMTERRIQQSAPAPAENKRKPPQDSPKRTPGSSEPGTVKPPAAPIFDKNMDFHQAVFMLNERARERTQSQQPSVPSPSEGRGRRERRQANGGNNNNNKRKRQNRRRKRTFSYRYRRSCTKHKMYVDFDEIGWSGWIISPKGYDAYHCSGECPFPLGQSQKPTNHATVQSIVHALRVGTKNLGTPCCVPSKLFSISLLYFDDDENVILKQYDDMVAASCGCH